MACSHTQPVIGWHITFKLIFCLWHSLLLILLSHQPRPAAAVHCTCSVATLRGTDRHKFPHISYQNLKVWIIMATTHTSISTRVIARPLGYEMWPKSACDFLAHLSPPRNRRLAGGYFGLRTPILCSIEFGYVMRETRKLQDYLFIIYRIGIRVVGRHDVLL